MLNDYKLNVEKLTLENEQLKTENSSLKNDIENKDNGVNVANYNILKVDYEQLKQEILDLKQVVQEKENSIHDLEEKLNHSNEDKDICMTEEYTYIRNQNRNVKDTDGVFDMKEFLTDNEYKVYMTLLNCSQDYQTVICPKVKLGTFIKLKSNKVKQYSEYIKTRYIDFLICDREMNPIAGVDVSNILVEDNNKATIFNTAGLPYYRIDTKRNPLRQVIAVYENLPQKR